MTQQEKLFPLKLFNKKFNDLSESSFIQVHLHDATLILKMDGNIQVPEKDMLKAFILDFRFFVQQNEKCSLKYLGDTHYPKLKISKEIKSDFKAQRHHFNSHLEMPTNFGENPENRYTLNDILWNYFYGKYAHANNKTKRDMVESWKESEYFKSIIEYAFRSVLTDLYEILKSIRDINQKAIEEIQK